MELEAKLRWRSLSHGRACLAKPFVWSVGKIQKLSELHYRPVENREKVVRHRAHQTDTDIRRSLRRAQHCRATDIDFAKKGDVMITSGMKHVADGREEASECDKTDQIADSQVRRLMREDCTADSSSRSIRRLDI